MRRLLVLVVCLAATTPAHAAPRALLRYPGDAALAGDTLLYTRVSGDRLRLFAQPLAGGSPAQVFVFTAPNGGRPNAGVAASPQRVALAVTVADETSEFAFLQAFAGPPSGPLSPLGPLVGLRDGAPIPWANQVDGERVFTTEVRGSLAHTAVIARDPDAHEVGHLETAASFTPVFAGEFVAYNTQAPGQGPDDIGRRVVVQEWRTGAVRTTIDLPDPVDDIALRADGRVAVVTTEHALYDGTRRLTGRADTVAFAGERIVFNSQNALRVIEPDGRIRAFGVPTSYLEGFKTDGTRVLWWTQKCLVLADASEPAANAIGKGPCPRSEAVVDEDADDAPVAPTVPVRLQCVAAPRHCRGSLRLTRGRLKTAKVRFDVATGRTGTVRVALGKRLYRHVRHVVAHERNTSLTAEIRTDDGFRPPGNAGQNVWISQRE